MRIFGSLALAGFVLLFGLTVMPIYNMRETVEATTGTATESSLTFTSVNPTASVSLAVSDPSGTFASSTDAQMAKFSISTTNYTGYTVSLKSSNQNLTDGANSLSPIPSALSEEDFSATANTTYNNKWGININNASTFVPVTSNVTIDETSSANTTAKEYTIALGVRADYTYTESIYYNTFIIEYVANQINYVINYDANAGSDTVTNMPTSPQTGYTSATSITIASEIPERDEYEFKGWCTVATSDENCSGMTYQPGATYGIDQTASNEITLHAMWEKGLPDLQIQNLASAACTTTPTEVYDVRDNEVYTVTRLADGKCWMTTNLNLKGGTVIDSTNSDVPEGYTLPTANGFQSGNKLPASETIFSGTTLSNSSAFSSDTTAYVFNSGNTICSSSSPCYSYYSWLAATAGSGVAIGSDSNAPYSICPKGWRLPSVGNAADITTDFRMLIIAYGGSSATQSYTPSTSPTGATIYGRIGPNTIPNFLLTGLYSGTSFAVGGSYGYYWSSTSINNANDARYQDLNFTNVGTSNNNRRAGFAVRCVMDETLQSFTSDDADAMTVGETRSLRDERDSEMYTVGKLADGNVWFLDNLRLDPTVTTLTPANTNVTSTVTKTFTNKTSGWSGSTTVYTEAWYNLGSKTTEQSYGSGKNKVGGYYNYCAASAGTYCMSLNSGSGNASQDICPAGWRMPTGGSGGEYEALYNKYNDYSTFKETLRASLSGFFLDASAFNQGSFGYFWSSTLYNTNYMDILGLDTSTVYPKYSFVRNHGASIRCVFDETISFKIGVTTYKALKGMTWGEWFASSYSPEGWQLQGNDTGSNMSFVSNGCNYNMNTSSSPQGPEDGKSYSYTGGTFCM